MLAQKETMLTQCGKDKDDFKHILENKEEQIKSGQMELSNAQSDKVIVGSM